MSGKNKTIKEEAEESFAHGGNDSHSSSDSDQQVAEQRTGRQDSLENCRPTLDPADISVIIRETVQACMEAWQAHQPHRRDGRAEAAAAPKQPVIDYD